MKRIICLLLALVITISALPLKIFADNIVSQQVSERITFEDPTVGEVVVSYIPVTLDAFNSSAYVSVEEAAVQLCNQMINRAATISVKVASSNSDGNEVWNSVWNAAFIHTGNPKGGSSLMWKECNGAINRDLSGNTVYYTLTYNIAYCTTAEQEAELDAAVEKLLSDLNLNGYSDYEKVFMIYKYICDNVAYDYDSDNSNSGLKFTPYAALINKKAVCNGYALLFYRLSLELGIDCRVITGQAGGLHAWNIVKLGNKYYNLDATWDAEQFSSGDFWYFLKSNENFMNHTSDDEFNSEEFKAKYPISSTDYVCEKEFIIINGTLYQYNGSGGEIIIPNTVTTISDNVFNGCSEVTDIKLPDSLKTISRYAFASCSALTEITIPNSVTSVGDYAFYMCSGLKSIVLSDNITYLGDYAFNYCRGLSSIVIPEDVPSIGENTFANTRLKYIHFLSPTTVIPDNSVSIPSETVICGYSNSTSQEYADKHGRTFIDLEDGVHAFGICGDNASWTLDANGTLTISGTGKMNNYYGSEPWRDYRNYIFSVVIKEGITEISGYAFYMCANLKRATISKSVTSVGSNSFSNCSALTDIFVSSSNEHLCDVDGVLFNKSLTRIIKYPEGKSITSYSIPTGIEVIDEHSFENCSHLTDIKIPNTVKIINSYAFYLCNSLSELVIPEGVTNIDKYAFYCCSKLSSIVIPKSVVSIGDGALYLCQNLKSVVFKSEDTEIHDSADTICSDAAIYGYKDSTASAYAEKYERTFVKLSDTGVVIGDLDENYIVDNNDAIYLLYATIFGEDYPLNQGCDFDNSGIVDNNDAIYLLYHTIFGEEEYPLTPTFTVTFIANADGVVGMPSQQRVIMGECAIKPAEPTREGYMFLNWYDNEACQGSPYDFNLPITGDVNLYADWLIDSDDNYVISNVSFDGLNTFTVSISSLKNVNLNISVLDEYMTTVLHTATSFVEIESEYLTEATCIINNFVVPEYFAVTVTLSDDNGNLLCEPYTSLKFTQRYQQSVSKTIFDFDEEQVINLDSQTDTNFIVADEDVKVLNFTDEISVIYDEINHTYTLSGDLSLLDFDEQIRKIVINANGTIHMIDVQSVSQQGDSLIITECTESDYKDFFSYIKIDDSAYGVQQDTAEQLEYDINQPPLLASLPDGSVGFEPGVEIKFHKDFEKDGIGYSDYYGEVDVTGSAKAFLRIIYDAVLLGEDYIEVQIGLEFDATAKANIGVKVEDNPIASDLTLGKLIFPFATSGVFFMAEVTLPFEWKFSGEVEVSATACYKFTNTYHSINGWLPEKHDPNASISLEAEGKVEMFWGLKVDMGVYFVNEDFLKISAPCKAGIAVEATVSSKGEISTTGVKHECTVCAVGNFYPKIEMLFTAQLKFSKYINGKYEMPIKLFDFSKNKNLFYLSIVNDEMSVHGGELKFGLGNCPNISYKTTISAIDENGYEHDTKLDVSGSFKMSNNVTSGAYVLEEELFLPDSVYLFNGIYTASTTIGNQVYSRRITVNKNIQKIDLLSYYIDGNITGKSYGIGLTDAKVTAYLADGYELVSFNTQNGKCDPEESSFKLPVGLNTIYVRVEHADYSTYYAVFSVPNITGVISLGNVRMKEYVPAYSYISGTVTDENSRPFSDVLVELYDVNGELVSYTVSNINGAYSFSLPLANGTYTLNFAKRGYAYNETVPNVIISDSIRAVHSIVTLQSTEVLGDLILTGFVTDIGGEPLNGVKVIVSGSSTVLATTNEDGAFAVKLNDIGYYKLTYTKSGYTPVVIDSFAVYEDSSTFDTVIMEKRPPLATGTCGENLTWILTEEGELTIYGTGPMQQWYNYDTVWKDYTSQIKNVIISEGVTNISMHAFSNCSNMLSISIPDSVTFIGGQAFYNCRSLTNIDIPKTVTNIGQGAFYYCSSLNSVIIPEGITKINAQLFTGCTGLESVYIPESVTSIGYGAFQNCHALVNIKIPLAVNEIDDYAFNRCLSLTDISIPEGITSIGYYTFSGCESLKNISLPGSLVKICNNAFEKCISLEGIDIPDSVTSIGTSVFRECISLKSIKIPKGVTSISDSLLLWCTALTDVTLHDGITSIGGSAFSSCSSIVSIDIPKSVTNIGDYVFNCCFNLASIDLPDGIESIGKGCFANCGNLQSIDIPESVITIGERAFVCCNSLVSVDIPESVEIVFSEAFRLCDKLERITFRSATTAIADNAVGYNVTICGYEGSTAQSYAKSRYMAFVAIS